MLTIYLPLTWLSLSSAETMIRLLGVTGSDVIGRVSGLSEGPAEAALD